MREFRVETYENAEKLYNELYLDENVLHVTGASQLAKHLKERINAKDKVHYIRTYDELQKALYPEWNYSMNILKTKIMIRKFLEDECSNSEEYYEYQKNIDQMVEEFRRYFEGGIKRIQDKGNRGYEIIRKVYERFAHSELVGELYTKVTPVNRIQFTTSLNELDLRIRKDKRVDIKEIDTVIFYNLNYIDVTRYALFKTLKDIGIQVVFRIPNHRYKGVDNKINEPWNRLYEFVQKDRWSKLQTESKYENYNKFEAYLNGDVVDLKDSNNIAFDVYKDIVQFKKQLKIKPLLQSDKELSRKEENIIIKKLGENKNRLADSNKYGERYRFLREYTTFSKEEFNNLFNGTIIDYKDKENSIFNFREGRFLNALYNIKWDKDGENIRLSYDDYYDLISSGWVQASKFNSDYCEDLLNDIREYMEGVETLEEIKRRLEKLTWLHGFSDVFDEVAKEDIDTHKAKEYLRNPLKTISYASNERYSITVKQLIELTKILERMIGNLIPKNNKILLFEHKNKIREHWVKIKHVNKILSEYDRETEKFKEKYKLYKYTEKSFSKGVLISEEMTLSETRDYFKILLMIGKNHGLDGYYEDYNYIKAFEQLEGIMINGTNEIYITDLSEKSIKKHINRRKFMNGRISSEEIFKKDLDMNDYDGSEISAIVNCSNESKRQSGNFIKYYISELINNFNGLIEFSWIDGISDNDSQSYIYKILSMIYVEAESTKKENEIRNDLGRLIRQKSKEIVGNKLNKNNINKEIGEEIAPCGWLDLDFCPRKFYYSNILNHNPVYSTDFHQRIVFSSFAKLLLSQNNDRKEIKEYLYPLFPQWTETTKDNLMDTSLKRNIREEYRFKNIYFPYYIRDIQVLRSSARADGKYRKRYNNHNIKTKDGINTLLKNVKDYEVKAKNGKHCDMCSYNMICVKGEFAIERSNRY